MIHPKISSQDASSILPFSCSKKARLPIYQSILYNMKISTTSCDGSLEIDFHTNFHMEKARDYQIVRSFLRAF